MTFDMAFGAGRTVRPPTRNANGKIPRNPRRRRKGVEIAPDSVTHCARMYSLLYRVGAWLLQKVSVGVLIAVLGLVAIGVWLFLKDTVDFDTRRSERVEALRAQRDTLAALQAEAVKRIEALQAELAEQERKVQQANRVIETLRSLESWWDRLVGNPEQQRANAEQIANMQRLQGSLAGKIAELQRTLTHASWEKEGMALSLARAEADLAQAEQTQTRAEHYLRLAWEKAGVYVIVALVLYFFGPSLWKLLMYYGLGPLLARSRPIRLADSIVALPDVTPSHVSIDAALWPGEILHVREKYLQASDEGLARKTRFLLDWRIPFTSLACGLSELVEMRNVTAGSERRVTFSNSDDPHAELALISLPEGTSLILRPSFLAGVITPPGQRLVIRRRWQLFRWQAWLTLQFRFFEFVGPCRLLVTGIRGVRAERLVDKDGARPRARRTNTAATIGFTPSLDYRPVRAETFWGYYRDMNPLFDDLFAGYGLFLVQETAGPGQATAAGKFWASLWNGLMKVFGL